MIALAAIAQTTAVSEKEQLRQAMYKYFNAGKQKEFFETTKRLKAICQKEGDEKLFYKAWGNEAIFTSNRKNRQGGLTIAQQIQEYAQKHDSKYGLYTATYISGSMLSNIGQHENAKSHLEKALEYRNRYLPEENVAPIYITLGRIVLNEHKYDKCLGYIEKVLDDPKSIPQHKSAALSMKCLASFGMQDTLTFTKTYKEHAELKKKYNVNDNFEGLVEVYRAMMQGQYEEALEYANKLTTESNRYNLKSRIYEQMGDYKNALRYHRKYKSFMDSINNNEIGRQSYEYAAQLDIARSENESKDLRLRNQQLKINQQKSELERRKLEDESMQLKLKNADIELANAAARRDNDSLTAYNQELQISEYQSKMEAQEQAQRARRTREAFLVLIAALTIATLAFLYWRRRSQIKQLKAVNLQLEQAEHAEREARLEAEHALQVKKNFIQNISHEVRTPLNSIYGFTQILTMPGIDLPQSEKDNLCQRIATSTNILTDVVDKMIELSHYDSMKTLEQNDRIDPSDLCQRLAEEYQAKADEGVTVRFANNLPASYTMLTNRGALEKVFRHLLDNAVKFTKKGEITIRAAVQGQPTFTVSDTGPGIPKEAQETIFEPFFDTGEQIKTTGMGLSICQTICNLLGGEIALDQTYTDGCCIRFNVNG